MQILLIFTKIQFSDLKTGKDDFSAKITDIARNTLLEENDANVNVQIAEGTVSNVFDDAKIVIFVSSDEIEQNSGTHIVDFKNQLRTLFLQYGVSLDKKELDVRVISSGDIQKITKQLKNNKGSYNNMANQQTELNDEFDYEKKSKQYIPVEPLYTFERVILPQSVKDKIEEAIGILECENKVFNEWGLYEIQPHPSTSLSFFGPSGTGKTMAAEAVAEKLGKKILKVSYADVESKYHGEGPKMVKAIFLAAKNADAVLFFDEADSLLSKRLTNVTQGSDQAINSMRSQLLICLEEFRGIVIFATNLIINYDQAFLTRLISIEFKNPDKDMRKTIWDVHIKPANDGKEHKLNIPLSADINTTELAEKYEFVGREIRNAVVSACVSVALEKRDMVSQKDFIKACEKIIDEKKAIEETKRREKATENFLSNAIKNKLAKESKSEDKDKKTSKESSEVKENVS